MDVAVYAFRVEWLDPFASLKRFYKLVYYVRPDGRDEVEMVDMKTRKSFLKRIHCPEVSLKDIFPGARVTIFSRNLTVLDYDNRVTREALSKVRERSFALVLPNGVNRVGEIWAALAEAGQRVARCKMVRLSAEDAASVVAAAEAGGAVEGEAVAHGRRACALAASGRSVALEVVGESSRSVVQEVLGRVSGGGEGAGAGEGGEGFLVLCSDAHAHDRCIDGVWQGVRGVKGSAEPPPPRPPRAPDGAELVVGGSLRLASVGAGCAEMGAESAVAVILPHVVSAGQAGQVLSALLSGVSAPPALTATDEKALASLEIEPASVGSAALRLTAMETFDLDAVTAEEFLEVYKLVLPEKDFGDDVTQLAAGVCVACEFSGPNAVATLRRVAGPRDADFAKALRPDTVRGKFALGNAKRALHTTDLPEDGPTEAEYFFAVLQETQPARDMPPVPDA